MNIPEAFTAFVEIFQKVDPADRTKLMEVINAYVGGSSYNLPPKLPEIPKSRGANYGTRNAPAA